MKSRGVKTEKDLVLHELRRIPGVGVSIANDLWNIGIRGLADLSGNDPEALYEASNRYAGTKQDRCLLYVFRSAVYFATESEHDPEKLKWWHWKD